MNARILTFQVRLNGGRKTHRWLKFLNDPDAVRARIDNQTAEILGLLNDFAASETLQRTGGLKLVSTKTEGGDQVIRVEVNPEFVFRFTSDQIKSPYKSGMGVFEEFMKFFAVNDFTVLADGTLRIADRVVMGEAMKVAYWLSKHPHLALHEELNTKRDSELEFRILVRVNSENLLTQNWGQFLELLKILSRVVD